MWKLDILREGLPPETHEGVHIAYEHHREGIAVPPSDTVVAYNALSERIRGIRAYGVMGGSIYPTFMEDYLQFKGRGGPIVEKMTRTAPVQPYLAHELEGEETWELRLLPKE